MSRFTVGEKVIFVSQSFTKEGDFHFLYQPWTDKNLNNEIIIATCLSEHDVPIEYSEKETAKGYIFSDQHGRIWYNQYPVASYGQTTDSADRQLILHDANIANIKKYEKHVKSDRAVNFNDNDMVHDWYFWKARPFTLQNYVDNVFRFVIGNDETRKKDEHIRKECNALEDYIGQLISEVENQGCEVHLVVKRIKFKNKDYSQPVFYTPPTVKIEWVKK